MPVTNEVQEKLMSDLFKKNKVTKTDQKVLKDLWLDVKDKQFYYGEARKAFEIEFGRLSKKK